jgi:hypothetical protein
MAELPQCEISAHIWQPVIKNLHLDNTLPFINREEK